MGVAKATYGRRVIETVGGKKIARLLREKVPTLFVPLDSPIVRIPLSLRTCRSTVIVGARNIRSASGRTRRDYAVTQDSRKMHRGREDRSVKEEGEGGRELLSREDSGGTPELSRIRDRAADPEICGSRNRAYVPNTFA